jgi:sulfatase maturation enzyme AslB (radical SAM superfamily)
MTTTTNDTFCINPHAHLLVETDGRMAFCCLFQRSTQDLNINKHTLDQFRADTTRAQVQQALNTGVRHPGCRECWSREALGSVSHRQVSNDRYNINSGNWRKFLPYIVTGDQLLDLEIQHTNTCNLKCYMCFDKNSHSLLAENRTLGLTSESTQYNWDLDIINDQILASKYLNIRGGEPLINESLRLKVEEWLDQGYLDNTRVVITTNCTEVDRWWPTLERIPDLQIMASVDGLGPVYDYLRFPGNWEQTSNNIQRLHALTPVTINTVVQNVNIFGLDQLIRWADDQNISMTLCSIDNPQIYRITNLPQGLLDSSLERLLALDVQNRLTREQLLGITTYLTNSLSDMSQWNDFWHMIYRRQGIRHNNVLDVFPELSNYERPRI